MGTTLAHTHMQFSCQLVHQPTLAQMLHLMQNPCQLVTPPELAQMLQHMQNPCQHWAHPELAHLLLRKNHAKWLQMLIPGEGVDLC